jgi:SPW repeat
MPQRLILADAWVAPHLRRSLKRRYDVVAKREWTTNLVLDLVKVGCAASLLIAPWFFALAPVPAWNLWVVAYLMLTCSLAKFVAEAEWEAQTNCCLGAWAMSAPWILGFSSDGSPTIVHVVGGSCVCILSAIELWGAQRNPPWRFGPSSALRPALLSSIINPPDRSVRRRRTYRLQRPAAPRTRRASAQRGGRIRPGSSQAGARWAPHANSVCFPGGLSNVRQSVEASRVA